MTRTLEIACDTVASALAAQAGGADRIELVSALGEGGLTPGVGKLLAIKERVDIPVFVMIRPRRADFCYDADDFAEMLSDIQVLKEYGADGIVSGILNADGNLDLDRMEQLREAAGDLPFTCHRAFDMTPNLLASMESLIGLGIERVLTSGGAASAPKGASMLRQLGWHGKDRIQIMAGAGVTPHSLPLLLNFPGIYEFHASAKVKVESPMTFRGSANMGNASEDEFSWYQADVQTVRDLKNHLS